MQSRTNSHWSCCLPKLIAVLVTAGKVQKNRRGFSGRCKGGPGENRNPLGLQIANRRSVCNLKRRKQAQRIRDVAPSGDSFRRGRFRRAAFSFGEAKENAEGQLLIRRRLSALYSLTTHPAGRDIYIRFPRYAPCGPVNYRPAAGQRSAWCAPCPPA